MVKVINQFQVVHKYMKNSTDEKILEAHLVRAGRQHGDYITQFFYIIGEKTEIKRLTFPSSYSIFFFIINPRYYLN